MMFVALYLVRDERISGDQQLFLLERSFSGLIERYQYLPAILANESKLKIAVEENDYGAELNPLLKLMSDTADAGVIYLMNESGRVISSSNAEESTSFLGKNYSFRPYFKDAIKHGRGSYYGVGVTSGIPGYFLSSKIHGHDEGTGVVTVKIEPHQIDEIWRETNRNIFVTNASDVILMSNNEQWLYQSVSDLNDEQRQSILEQKQFSFHQTNKIVHRKIYLPWPNLRIWQIGNQYHVVNSIELNPSSHYISGTWSIHLSTPIKGMLPRLIYAAIGVAFFLFSVYIFLQHRRVLEYSQQVKDEADRYRREQLQSIINATQVGLITLDDNGRIQSSNPAIRAMLNISESQQNLLIGDYIKELSTEEHRLNVLDTGFVESRLHGNDTQTLPVMFSLGSISIDESDYVVTVVDITKRKNAERQLQKLNSQLETLVEERTSELKSVQQELVRQEKMIVLGRMAGAIVHELSQPIVAFKSALASLGVKKQRGDIEGIGDSINNMAPLCEHMQDVIVQLKAFGYQGNPERTSIELSDELIKIVSSFSDSCVYWQEENLMSHHLQLNANATLLEMIFNNLIRNGIEAVKDVDNPRVQVSVEKSADKYCIIVRDNGGKISTEIAEHLFEPFFTTKSLGQGLGLGLAIANNIVRELGGEINLDYDNESTTFRVEFPVAV